MNHLLKELAPLSEDAWAEIENEAKRTLDRYLAARRVVDFIGPKGWEKSAVKTGHVKTVGTSKDGIAVEERIVLPMLEFRVPFTLDIAEMRAISRGSEDAELAPVVEAAKKAAGLEDEIVFSGFKGSAIDGMLTGSEHAEIKLGTKYDRFPEAVSKALSQLHDAGIKGPYALVLGSAEYEALLQGTQDGYPVIEHIEELVDCPVIWSAALKGGLLVSQRGGDFLLTSGEDFSIGYSHSDAKTVTLYLEESFTFYNASPDAVVPLKKG